MCIRDSPRAVPVVQVAGTSTETPPSFTVRVADAAAVVDAGELWFWSVLAVSFAAGVAPAAAPAALCRADAGSPPPAAAIDDTGIAEPALNIGSCLLYTSRCV